MTVREIQQHLTEMYGAEVSPTLISTVTDGDGVMDEVKQWQSRPLDTVYPVIYLDCIHAKFVTHLTGLLSNLKKECLDTINRRLHKIQDTFQTAFKY
jgi:hypothetical protein